MDRGIGWGRFRVVEVEVYRGMRISERQNYFESPIEENPEPGRRARLHQSLDGFLTDILTLLCGCLTPGFWVQNGSWVGCTEDDILRKQFSQNFVNSFRAPNFGNPNELCKKMTVLDLSKLRDF